jgi:predicted amidohydrolase YtcJ
MSFCTHLSCIGIATVSATLLTFASCSGPKPEPADLVLRSGKVAVVDSAFTFARALAVRGDRIVFTGSIKDAEKYIGPQTRVIDLGGKLVIPGLIDAHVHLRGLGDALSRLDFRGTTSFQQIADMVAAEAKKSAPGEWIIGRSWDQNDWESNEMPTHDLLTKAAPDNPVWLTRVDGHAAVVNRKAMERAGITARSKSPSGGEILRDQSGQPTGVFVDAAMDLVGGRVSDRTPEQVEKSLELAAQRCLETGLTGVHDAGVSPGTIAIYKRLIDQGRLNLRLYGMLGDPGEGSDIAEYLKQNRVEAYGNHFLEVRSLKLFADGALGSRGAVLFADYTDRPGYTGLLTTTPEHLLAASRAALETGFQVCTHAIGDRGNRLTLDAYEQALREHPHRDHRFRIEHAQVVAPEDFPRFASLGVIPSMQPTHATSDMYWAEARLGPERVKGAYAWRKFLELGCYVPCGSDFPVEEYNPLLGFYAAVTRRDLAGKPENGWFPDQCMTREEVLRGFTIWAAKAAFQDSILGSLETGKLADIVVLDKDILTCKPEEIPGAKPEMVILGGKVKYEKSVQNPKSKVQNE